MKIYDGRNYWWGLVVHDCSHHASYATDPYPTPVRKAQRPFLKNASQTLAFASGSPSKNEEEQQPMEESFISCRFSFSIRRDHDKWGIPSMIVQSW